MTQPQEQHSSTFSDVIVQTHHRVHVGQRELAYTVTTGTIVLREESKKKGDHAGVSEGERARATLFFVAYTLDGVEHKATRPITFAFNGGPGSSSVWLHLGLLGPRRVEMHSDAQLLPPPYRLVENEYTLLDVSDLVFIDPVSTGYSRAVEGERADQFHGFKRDLESVGDFIRLYTTRYQRWASPKFLAGESYGTTRAAGLAGYLQQRHGLYLNGLMLISSVMNFQTLLFEHGNDLPYVLFLPTYTATAWYHQRLANVLQKMDLRTLLAEVEEFALGEYNTALMRGSMLTSTDIARITRRLVRYTGLSEAYIQRSQLRIQDDRFVKELLRDTGRTVGRLDSRYTGADRDSVGERNEFDPSYTAIHGPFTASLYDYVRGDLRFESDLAYEILTGHVHPWSFAEHQNRYLDVAETLRQAMAVNPHLRVYVASGYYDLATPYFATEYTLNHLGLNGSSGASIQRSFFEAGHMMYIHEPSMLALKQDLARFVSHADGSSP